MYPPGFTRRDFEKGEVVLREHDTDALNVKQIPWALSEYGGGDVKENLVGTEVISSSSSSGFRMVSGFEGGTGCAGKYGSCCSSKPARDNFSMLDELSATIGVGMHCVTS
ncbi:hypothetical protein L6452_39051 [Arctium lappa]|uniref:Uncharacterized protein n=1 Tax=Arctium lappa TaxID=4217 RepID=A0ACB8XSY0_ARCLA|nr:hypothetical protein L6452_39051 [Arctium lappa]